MKTIIRFTNWEEIEVSESVDSINKSRIGNALCMYVTFIYYKKVFKEVWFWKTIKVEKIEQRQDILLQKKDILYCYGK